MATRITVKGQVTIPKRIRDALRLRPGDGVEFAPNARGEVVVSKAEPAAAARGHVGHHPRSEGQMRRRAEELLALLRGLD